MRWRRAIGGLLVLVVATIAPNPSRAVEQCGAQQISPAALNQTLVEGNNANILLIDTRSRDDFLVGTLPTAITVAKLQDIIAGTHDDRQDAYVVVVTKEGDLDDATLDWVERLCAGGVETWILQGGINGWLAAGIGLEKPEDRLTVPGNVPFVIPRGLCEMNDPVLEYN
jgi:thiosulfate/3-mercaptopyruvate sulfurtransferase